MLGVLGNLNSLHWHLADLLRSSKTNLELLMEDLRGLPEFVAGWTFYGWVSGAYSRLSHKDVRVSYGEALQQFCLIFP